MKKMIIMAMMMVMTMSANAMSYSAAKNEALFLSDKMAYELNLTASQYEAVYEINLDYMMSVNGRNDAYGTWWKRRNTDLKYVLTAWQYEKYMDKSYFYRPLSWKNGSWTFNIRSHYSSGGHFKTNPANFASYKGGNNKKNDRYYADKKVTKPTATLADKHSTAKKNDTKPRREIAKTTSKYTSKSGHFSGRR